MFSLPDGKLKSCNPSRDRARVAQLSCVCVCVPISKGIPSAEWSYMMVVLMIWHTLAFCDPLLDHNWTSSTTSSTECGGHVDFRCSVLRVAAGWWLCFVFVLGCVCFGFRTCSVSPLALRSLRTAYCAADVVKRQWSKKKMTTAPPEPPVTVSSVSWENM